MTKIFPALGAASQSARERYSRAYPGRLGQILLLLIVIDLGMTVWNAAAFAPNQQYDPEMHAGRIATCGVYTSGRYYNPPLYYALACPAMIVSLAGQVDIVNDIARPLMSGASMDEVIDIVRPKLHRVTLVDKAAGPFLQAVNVGMYAAVIGIWIVYLFPRYLAPGAAAFIAASLLLALPGFQKITAMTNPDNMLVFGTTLGFFAFTRLTDATRIGWRAVVLFGLLIGAIGLTRPFAAIPMLFLGLAFGALLWRRSLGGGGAALKTAALKFVAFGVVAALMAGSWWGYRQVMTGDAFTLYAEDSEYNRIHQERRKEFDFGEYYSTFHYAELLKVPNRHIGGYDPEDPDWRKSLNNSFATLLFSDYWADHWLYFSGPVPREIDDNVLPKRIILLYALPLSLALLALMAYGAARQIGTARTTPYAAEIWSLAATLIFGFALYVLWQQGQSLEPGKNSQVKFIYTANLAPIAALFIAAGTPKKAEPLLIAALGLLFVLALPMSFYRW